MGRHPLPMSAAHAMAFCQAYDDRTAYIAEQPWSVRAQIGFEESVPMPGCPHCWREVVGVRWDVLAHEVWTSVEPCGHWFTTDRPVIVHRTESGWATVEEWLP